MVIGPVNFLEATPANPDGYNLFFANRGQYKLYQLLGIRTFNQFGQYLKGLGSDGVPPEDLDKMVYAGLIWQHRSMTLSEAEDIVEQFYLSGKTLNDLNNVVMAALASAELIDRRVYAISQRYAQLSEEELEQKILEEIGKSRRPKTEGEDMGEAGTIPT